MSMFPDTMEELKVQHVKERTAHDKVLQREIVLEAQLAFLRERIAQMAREYKFTDAPVKGRYVAANLQAILKEEV